MMMALHMAAISYQANNGSFPIPYPGVPSWNMAAYPHCNLRLRPASPVRCSCSHGDGDDHHQQEGCQPEPSPPFGLFLHDLMDQAGIDTTHAKVARQSFVKQVDKFATDARSNPISNMHCLDLARAALDVSAEDDALVSHSPVALPVDSYLERLNSMAIEFAGHHLPSQSYTPETVLCCLSNYLFGYKGFQAMLPNDYGDARGCYLNMVLTRRSGTPVMLALIYSELVKILKSWGVIDFDVDMELPEDKKCLPSAKLLLTSCEQANDDIAPPRILTPQNLLVDILATLKQVYWPWKLLNGSTEGTDFLKAADAANHGIHMSAGTPVQSLFKAPTNTMGAEVASARAATHRLQRGIWTSTSFGDMRRALAASERLVLLGIERKELRDYGILLYHCGLYRPSFAYLNHYYISECNHGTSSSDMLKSQEIIALENVLLRLRLILAEQDWHTQSTGNFFDTSVTEPW